MIDTSVRPPPLLATNTTQVQHILYNPAAPPPNPAFHPAVMNPAYFQAACQPPSSVPYSVAAPQASWQASGQSAAVNTAVTAQASTKSASIHIVTDPVTKRPVQLLCGSLAGNPVAAEAVTMKNALPAASTSKDGDPWYSVANLYVGTTRKQSRIPPASSSPKKKKKIKITSAPSIIAITTQSKKSVSGDKTERQSVFHRLGRKKKKKLRVIKAPNMVWKNPNLT